MSTLTLYMSFEKNRLGILYPALLLLHLLTALPSQSYAAVVEGVRFNEQVVTERGTLPLRGAGLLRYMLVVKAYVGALYLPENVPSSNLLDDVPKHLVIEYFHAIKGDAFGPVATQSMRKNITSEKLAHLMPKINFYNSLYEDVQPGDRYSLTYLPGKGTTLRLNGRELGTVKGADFAEAIFSIWLGPTPINAGFKKALEGTG